MLSAREVAPEGSEEMNEGREVKSTQDGDSANNDLRATEGKTKVAGQEPASGKKPAARKRPTVRKTARGAETVPAEETVAVRETVAVAVRETVAVAEQETVALAAQETVALAAQETVALAAQETVAAKDIVEEKDTMADRGTAEGEAVAGGCGESVGGQEAQTGAGEKQQARSVRNDLAMVRKLIDRLSESLTTEGSMKGTMGDLMKLLQLEKDLTPQRERRQITVKWVAPWED
jgi:hypothetical protein